MTGNDLAANVSRETFERLQHYAGMLEKWNKRINLVSRGTIPELWTRHFLDSAQIMDLAPEGSKWADLGSGGGFPGLVIAILAAEKRPDMAMTLVESDQRKCAFLRSVARETGVPVAIRTERIESLDPLGADVLSARALAALDMLLGFCERHLLAGGTAVFPKGTRWKEEISEAEKLWHFRYEAVPSTTDSEAVILKIGGIRRVPSA